MTFSFDITFLKKIKSAFTSSTKVQIITLYAVLFAIILAITLGITLSSGLTGQSQTDQGRTNQTSQSLSDEKKCVEAERTFHPTIDGFEARSDHISECLQTCGNEGNTVKTREEKIINGQIPNMNSWPFLVRLIIFTGEQSEMCGGTILNNRSRSKVLYSRSNIRETHKLAHILVAQLEHTRMVHLHKICM